MDKVVEKVLEIIAKLSDEQKALILEKLTPAPEKKEEVAEGGDASLNPRSNPEVQDQQSLMEKFLQHGVNR